MYPRVLHQGPITDRRVLKVHDAESEQAALSAGWSRTPSSWADLDAPVDVGVVVNNAPEPLDAAPVKSKRGKK